MFYYHHTIPMHRQAASDYCRKDGASLPVPKDSHQNQFFRDFFPDETIWLGIHSDYYFEAGVRYWYWVDDNNKLISWFNWNEGEPNVNPFDTYVEMQSNGKWNDEYLHFLSYRTFWCVYVVSNE